MTFEVWINSKYTYVQSCQHKMKDSGNVAASSLQKVINWLNRWAWISFVPFMNWNGILSRLRMPLLLSSCIIWREFVYNISIVLLPLKTRIHYGIHYCRPTKFLFRTLNCSPSRSLFLSIFFHFLAITLTNDKCAVSHLVNTNHDPTIISTYPWEFSFVISFVHSIRKNANDSRRYHLFIWMCTFIYCITKQIAHPINMAYQYNSNNTHVCVYMYAHFSLSFLQWLAKKFTSMCNTNRVYDLCAICMFKRNSNQIIALLVRTCIKHYACVWCVFFYFLRIMLTKRLISLLDVWHHPLKSFFLYIWITHQFPI